MIEAASGDNLVPDRIPGLERELENLRQDVHRLEDRIETRLDRQDTETNDFRERFEATAEDRHKENSKRLDALEKYLNQGVGAVSALQYTWYLIVGAGSALAGYFASMLNGKTGH